MENEHFAGRIRIITKTAAVACLLSMVLSYPLWLSDRTFPLSPVVSYFPSIPALWGTALFVFAGICLLLIPFLKNPQKILALFLVAALVLGLLDQNRWQPWFYQYVLMFAILSSYRDNGSQHSNAVFLALRIMMAAVYFWSGLQKLNPRFLSDTFPWLMEPFTSRLGYTPGGIMLLGYSFPLIEACCGLLLLIRPFRRAALVTVILMHCFILLVLSPFGHNYNFVVWPWNAAMIVFNVLLFGNSIAISFSEIKILARYRMILLPVLLFALMPLLNFFNAWDSYLSHNLYSGNTSNGVIYISEEVQNALPEHIRQYTIEDQGQYLVNIKYWCLKETGVPAYPEKRNFESVTSHLYRYTSDSSDIYLLYTPKLKAGQR